MLTPEKVIHLIKTNQAPYWKLLGAKDGFSQKYVVATYSCENVPEGATDDTRIDKSIEAFNKQVEVFKSVPNMVFAIECRQKKTSNGETKYGPFEFMMQEQAPAAQAAAANAGLGNPFAMAELQGYAPIQQMQGMMSLMQEKTAFEIEKVLLKRDREEFDKEKKEMQKELDEKYKEYSNLQNAVKTGSQKGIINGVLKIAEGLGWIDPEEEKTLKGALNQPAKKEEEEPTQEETAALAVAETLVEKGYSVAEIKAVGKVVKVITDSELSGKQLNGLDKALTAIINKNSKTE